MPPTLAAASCPAAALTGTTVLWAGARGVAALSSTFPSVLASWAVGQTLNETRPTRLTNTIAAPASSAPDAPTPTMKLSGVLFDDVLGAE